MTRGVYVRKPVTEEHKRNISIAMKGHKVSEETKIKISERAKKQHKENSNFGMKGKHHSEETIKKMSSAQKGDKNWLFGKHHQLSEKTKQKISNTLMGHSISEETIKKMSLAQIGSKSFRFGKHFKLSEEAKRKIREARKKQIVPYRDTKIEVKIQNFLKLCHVEFLTHQYISKITHSYQCDIFIPSIKTIIECDGCYWHGCLICNKQLNEFQEKQVEEDKIRTKELIEKGYKVIRLKEHEIKKLELNEFEDILKCNTQ